MGAHLLHLRPSQPSYRVTGYFFCSYPTPPLFHPLLFCQPRLVPEEWGFPGGTVLETVQSDPGSRTTPTLPWEGGTQSPPTPLYRQVT